jgi:hypothetical protein
MFRRFDRPERLRMKEVIHKKNSLRMSQALHSSCMLSCLVQGRAINLTIHETFYEQHATGDHQTLYFHLPIIK